MQFFCKMNKKHIEKAQFDNVHEVEKNQNRREIVRVLSEQKAIEWEVSKFYWKLYHKEEWNIDTTLYQVGTRIK